MVLHIFICPSNLNIVCWVPLLLVEHCGLDTNRRHGSYKKKSNSITELLLCDELFISFSENHYRGCSVTSDAFHRGTNGNYEFDACFLPDAMDDWR